MYIQRKLEANIHDYLDTKKNKGGEALLLSGARQVGKSSLIREIIKKHPSLYINLSESALLCEELDRTQSFAEFERLLLANFNFKPSQGVVLVIDEAQESKKIGRWIRFFKENWSGQRVIILGSILSRLFAEQGTYPVGRVIEYTLRPFNFVEFLRAIKQSGQIEIIQNTSLKKRISEVEQGIIFKSYTKYLQTGGMPNTVVQCMETQQPPTFMIEQLLHQYAMDVARYLGENYRSLFLSTVKRIAELTCQPSKNSEIISTNSPSYRKLPILLEILRQWHLVFRSNIKTKQPESAGGYSSKKYLFDLGFTSFFLCQNNPVRLKDRSEIENNIYGKLQENFVMNELAASHPSGHFEPVYFRENHNSKEIDFVITIGGKQLPVEVKSQGGINRNSLVPMVNFLNQTKGSRGILIYNGPMTSLRYGGKTIHALPPFMVSEIGRLFS